MAGNPTQEGGFPTMYLEIQPLPLVGPDAVVHQRQRGNPSPTFLNTYCYVQDFITVSVVALPFFQARRSLTLDRGGPALLIV